MALAGDLNLIEPEEERGEVPEVESTPAESETRDLDMSQACSGRTGERTIAIDPEDATDVVMIPSLDSSPKITKPQGVPGFGAAASAATSLDRSTASDVPLPTAASVAAFAALAARGCGAAVLSAPNLQLLATFLLGETQRLPGACSRLLSETTGRGGPLTARWQTVLGAWLQQQADHRTRMMLVPLALCNPASVPFLISMLTPPQLATLPQQAHQLLEQALRYHAATAACESVAASQHL